MSDENKVQIEKEENCVEQKPLNIGEPTFEKCEVKPAIFGKRYHEERTKKFLSHEQVRKRIMDMTGEDVSVSYLQKIERGDCKSWEWCCRLAKFFDVCAEYFAGEVNDRWIVKEKDNNSIYPEKRTETKWRVAIKREDKNKLLPLLREHEEAVETFVRKRTESIYADLFYRLAYANPKEQEDFLHLWELQKQYVKNREKDQRKEDELRKSLTKKYTLHKENPEIEKRIGYAFYKLAKENEGLFKVLYEVASDSNSRAQFQTIMMRNYQYKEWSD